LYGVTVPALAVTRMNIARDGPRITISGEVAGFAGQRLRLERIAGDGHADLDLAVDVSGARARILAHDDVVPGQVTYRLYADERPLWSQSVDSRETPRLLALVGIHPNPSRGAVSLTVEVDDDVTAVVGIYDVSGRRVVASDRLLAAGTNVVTLAEPARLAAGVYFVRVTARGTSAQRKLVIVR